MSLDIQLQRVAQKCLGRSGFDYEVFDGDALVCHGWAAGSEQRARKEANEHAERVLRRREKARLAAITGDTD